MAERKLHRWPSISSQPASGEWTPLRTFSRVLLPAPFSPQRPCTVPDSTLNVTSESAWTPLKPLDIA